MSTTPRTGAERREALQRARHEVLNDLLHHVDARRPLMVLKAPPGSGKTYALLRAIALAAHRRLRVAVATQTNNQADDLCRRLAKEFPAVVTHRFAGSGYDPGDLGASVAVIHAGRELPHGPCVVVATTAKWACTRDAPSFDLVLVDEAWQMTWADFMLLSPLAPRFVLVGDPGQIAPTVTVETARWETAPRPPHRAAPAVILADAELPAEVRALPVTTRLPHDAAELVQTFYDFPFASWAAPGERAVRADPKRRRSPGVDDAIDLLATGSVALLTLPTPDAGPVDDDAGVADAVARLVRRFINRRAAALVDGELRALLPSDIGVVATHRAMNARLAEALGPLAGAVRVDTPERWQGLERKVMVAVHPLSGVSDPTEFDLATGRLCVMTSRHQAGLVLVSRDHVGDTLDGFAPSAAQAPGARDEAGRGHAQNADVWRWLHARGRVARA